MKILTFLLFALAMFSQSVAATTWVDGIASMKIGHAPLDEVRRMTIKNAVADASYRGGYMISAQDVMLNGVLLDSTVTLSTKSVIKSVEILNESIVDDVLTVQVSVKLGDDEPCAQTQYKKNVLVTPFFIDEPVQMAIGQIFDIGSHIGLRYDQQIKLQSSSMSSRFINQYLSTGLTSSHPLSSELPQIAGYLLKEFQSQYVLFGKVDDMSLYEKTSVSRGFRVEESKLYRNFTITLFLLDTVEKSIIHQDRYHMSAPWNFPINNIVDLGSSAFWRSQFGSAMLHLIAESIESIETAVRCKPAYTLITSRQDEGYLIGLGKKHGVKKGDKLSLFKLPQPVLKSTFQHIKRIENEQVYFTASQIYQDYSYIVPSEAALMDVQLNDLVSAQQIAAE
ncbi:MAG: flagella assembly protein FlgT middle domain-containing protein [Pseudomonadota bacterium]